MEFEQLIKLVADLGPDAKEVVMHYFIYLYFQQVAMIAVVGGFVLAGFTLLRKVINHEIGK